MESSIQYDRASGYFGSSVYYLIWSGLKKFIQNDGKIRLICSPFLSKEDQQAIEDGYVLKKNNIEEHIQTQIQSMAENPDTNFALRALSCMIANGILEIKLCVSEDNQNEVDYKLNKFFHDKYGIFVDDCKNKVVFSGPMNETFKGLDAVENGGNIEHLDVSRSWMGEDSVERISSATINFERLWNNCYTGIEVIEFPEVSKKLLEHYSKSADWQNMLDEIEVRSKPKSIWEIEGSPLHPRKHQKKVLDSWKANDYRGLVKHATGSGKTFTGACAINYAFKNKHLPIIIVPSRELLYQWQSDLRYYFGDRQLRIVLCGDGHVAWKKTLKHYTVEPLPNLIIISIVHTASSDFFINSISEPDNMLLIADEVHRLGSSTFQKLFQVPAGWKIGMSATPERYGDPEGTQIITEYFDTILQPEYGLTDAIKNGDLCPYNYHPHLIELDEKEQQKWDSFRKRITIAKSAYDRDPSEENRLRLNLLYIRRSKIVKHVSSKIPFCKKIIDEHYQNGQRWIVYCDDTNQLNAVCDALRNYHPIPYHSDMLGARSDTLDYFESIGGILVAIKCFDEGVSINSVSHAVILASSKNPREFIQRRGRVLRKSPGKQVAEIYDVIVAPSVKCAEDASNSILLSELARSIEFAKDSISASSIHQLEEIAIRYDIDIASVSGWGYEDE